MACNTNTLEIIRGDDESIDVTIKDLNNESQLKSGNILSLTVKKDIKDSDDDAIFKQDYILPLDTEIYTIDLSHTETDLPLGQYFADVQWVDNFDKIKTIYRGGFEVQYDITRRDP